jgi:peptide-methionine (S)-S-oxide reductase
MKINSYYQQSLDPAHALPGRTTPMPVPAAHYVKGTPLKGPFPDNCQQILLGMGCFWGAERKLWQTQGVYTTAAGYAGGQTPNPDYQEICSGLTGHCEVILVVYDRTLITIETLLALFWECHDPTQGMRQGNDIGSQYRSAIYTYTDHQLTAALDSRDQYQNNLSAAGVGRITTEITMVREFYYAEPYHQQYLAKNPGGYCALGSTGVCFLPKPG